ncbi:MAG TPA: hypothetical protein VEH81_05410, partial [Ktedonobacteraceae bacterium]|nr:hypothetical protein [Ktedonobacteraceae bacterium]
VHKAEPLRLEYQDVLAALSNDTAPTVTGEDGIAVLKVVHMISEAVHRRATSSQKAKVSTEVEA